MFRPVEVSAMLRGEVVRSTLPSGLSGEERIFRVHICLLLRALTIAIRGPFLKLLQSGRRSEKKPGPRTVSQLLRKSPRKRRE